MWRKVIAAAGGKCGALPEIVLSIDWIASFRVNTPWL
tara:strand:- start:1 stop:111 length:111 start_codon:yes stop_codon:yes gene_type:complete